MSDKTKRVVSVLVENESSALSRVSGLFAGRGYNIETLTVAPVPGTNRSRITIVTRGNQRVLEQITKQLHKLIPVHKVVEHEEMVEKEMVLAKFPITESLADIQALCDAYNGEIVNVGSDMIIGMAADEPIRIKHFVEASSRYNPIEIIRGGVVAMER
jgi:acetolactate synthase-1/3 small subunit